MSFPGRPAQNHPAQVKARGALDAVDDRRTPDDLFAVLHERFNFTVDAAASAENTKLPRYFDREQDGLAQPWEGERVWCNPPYSDIPAWVHKAWAQMMVGRAELVVMLLPATRTEQPWWQGSVEAFRGGLIVRGVRLDVEFLPGRIKFGNAKAAPCGRNRPYFGCCLVIWWRP